MTTATVTVANESSITGYQLRLPVFEGPLDVLLRLIERNQLEITDVSLVEVTDQFLAYVANLPETSPAVVAEFTTIASRLLLLKSRSLLPSEPVQDDETEPDDLTRQLIAYKSVRDTAEMLRARQADGLESYSRPPTADDWGESAETLLQMPASVLSRALRRCFGRQAPDPNDYRPRPVISLADMTRRIVHRLSRRGRTRFSSLLSRHPDRHEYVAGFVTLLTLWKQRTIDVWQEERFAEIEVIPASVREQVADD